MSSRFKPLVLVCGVGEISSAIAHRLFRARFRVVLTEDDPERELMKYNSFSRVFTEGSCEVEGVPARQAVVTEALGMIDQGSLPVLSVDPRSALDALNPEIIVDGREKRRGGEGVETRQALAVGDASLIISATSDFELGETCDMAIIAERGFHMARTLTSVFEKRPETLGTTESVSDEEPVIPIVTDVSGPFGYLKRIGEPVDRDEPIGVVRDRELVSPEPGILKGTVAGGTVVDAGAIVAEVDRRGHEEYIYAISDLGRAVAGSVLEMAVSWSVDMGALARPDFYQPGS